MNSSHDLPAEHSVLNIEFATTAELFEVLAIHEAALLACRLNEELETSPPTPCSLHVEIEPHMMVVEIGLPRSVEFPRPLLDTDPLRFVRAFSGAASWTGTLRTRTIRVVAEAGR